MKTLETLEVEAREANRKLADARQQECERHNHALQGKCFKYRNCYSCPEKPSDYWWTYFHVTGSDGYEIVGHHFEIDKNGKIEINLARRMSVYWNGIGDGYKPIKRSELNNAWRALKKRVASA